MTATKQTIEMVILSLHIMLWFHRTYCYCDHDCFLDISPQSDTAGHEGIDATGSSQKHHRENVINSLLQNYDSLMRPHFDESKY